MHEKLHVWPTRTPRCALAVFAAVLLVSACGAPAHNQGPLQTTPSPRARTSSGPPTHVAVIVMENEEYSDIMSSRSSPFINALAHRWAVARSAYAIAHPSLPNYLALTAGSTFGIDSDCTDCHLPGAGLPGQLQAARITWKAYMEDMPHPCFRGAAAYPYAKKHDPFMYYEGVARDPRACGRVVPMSQLQADERARSLPRFIWISPNLCHDMHDCSVSTGDRFLRSLVPPLLNALGRRGLLILTWDEGTTDDGCCRLAHGGHVATILAGGEVRRHASMSAPTDHYSILQLIDDLFEMRRLRGAACACTPTLQPLLRGH